MVTGADVIKIIKLIVEIKAKVVKVTDENKRLHEKCDELEKQIDKLTKGI